MNEDKIEFDNPNFIPSNKAVFPLKYCTFEVWPEINFVETKFPDDFSCGAIRELNEDNLREVTCQGYIGEMPIWKSLVEHEYLHSLISELLYDRPSLVLETESGKKFHPSWLRYQEEAIVIGVQYLLSNPDPRLRLDRESVARKTFDFVGREADLLRINIVDFLSRCRQSVQALWSQIEKDSQ